MSVTPSIPISSPYLATIPQGTTIQAPLTIYTSGKFVWQNDVTNALEIGIYSGTTVEGSAGMLRVCGANAWGTRTLTAGLYTVTLAQAPSATPANISATVEIRPWSIGDYFNFAFSLFGVQFWPNKYPSSC